MSEKVPKNPTIYDIARAVELHPGTVSKILSGKYRFASASAEKVRRVAHELGFVPDRRAAHLAQRKRKQDDRAGLIPVVLLTRGRRSDNEPGINAEGLRQTRGSTIPKAAPEMARQMGYYIERINLHGKHAKAVGRQLLARGVEGILLGSLYPFDERPELPWEAFSMVGIGGSYLSYQVDRVSCDLLKGVTLAHQVARERGYRRIGCVLPEHDLKWEDDDRRLAGVLLAQRQGGGDRVEPLLYPVREDYSSRMAGWLKRERPDCVVCFSAAGIYKLRELGLAAPQDIGFLALHGGVETAERHGVATVVAQRSDAIFIQALHLLDSHIRSQKLGWPNEPILSMMEPYFVDGPSLRKPD